MPPGGPSYAPSTPCRNCFAAVPFGSRVCPRCGASTDFLPVAERARNTGPTFLGIGAALAVFFIFPTLLTGAAVRAAAGQESVYTFVVGINIAAFLGLIVISIVLLVRNPRSSPYRAFGFAALITVLVLAGITVVLIGGFFLVCYLLINSANHH